MAITTYPTPSSGSTNSTVLPVNASGVLLDGELTSTTSYTTTVNGNGGIAYLVANDNTAIFNVGGTQYIVPAGSVVPSNAFGSSTSVTVTNGPLPPFTSNWTSSTLTASYDWAGVNYGTISGTGYWVAVQASGNTLFNYSTDGKTWIAGTMPSTATWSSLGYGNGYFVAMGGGYVAYTNTLSSWTLLSLTNAVGTGTVAASQSIIYVSSLSKYIAMTSSASSSYYYSTTPSGWTAGTMPTSGGWDYGVCWSGTYLVAGSGGNGYIAYSTNGTSWTAYQVISSSTLPYMIQYGNGLFVAINYSNNTGYYASSPNGTWTSQTLPLPVSYLGDTGYFGFIFANGYFVAVLPSGSGAYSTNGTTWTAFTGVPAGSIGYGNNQFVALTNTVNKSYLSTTNSSLPISFGIYEGPTTIH